jgi:hypothetical protein
VGLRRKVNTHIQRKLQTKLRLGGKKTLSGTNPVIVDGDEVKVGHPVDVDLEEGGGNQSQLSFCLKR